MSRGIVYVMAKAPVAGAVKTRLSPPLTPLQASSLAAAFATDLLANLAAIPHLDVRLALDHKRERAAGGLRALARALGVAVEDQGSGDLGARMAMLVERGIASGAATLLIGSDAPDLPASLVTSALDALGRTDVVLVPSRDGGYVLAGARRVVHALFSIDAPWSSSHVFAATCRSLTDAGCPFETFAPWEDIDDAAALGRLAVRLRGRGAASAPATAQLMEQWRSNGVRI